MLGRYVRRTQCADNLHLDEELGGVDFGGRWTGVPSSEARSGSTPPRFPAFRISLKTSPSPPGLSLVYTGSLEGQRDQPGWRGRMLNSLDSNFPGLPLSSSLLRASRTPTSQPPIHYPAFFPCPITSEGPWQDFGPPLLRAAEG